MSKNANKMNQSISFESMIEEYHPMIYKICRVYSSSSDFEDLYQEVLINLWKSLKSYQGRSKLSTWLYRVVLNTALTYNRNTKKDKDNIPLDNIQEIEDPGNAAASKQLEIDRLYKAISQLDKNDRSLILLYLEENSYEEIAEITGLSMSNVGVKINRLKKKLFTILNQA